MGSSRGPRQPLPSEGCHEGCVPARRPIAIPHAAHACEASVLSLDTTYRGTALTRNLILHGACHRLKMTSRRRGRSEPTRI